jgi:hypothetical protein
MKRKPIPIEVLQYVLESDIHRVLSHAEILKWTEALPTRVPKFDPDITVATEPVHGKFLKLVLFRETPTKTGGSKENKESELET